MIHPNQQKQHHHVYKGCAKYLHRFDEFIMKPIFIYKYEKGMQKKSKEFFNICNKQLDQVEKDYLEEHNRKKEIKIEKDIDMS